MASGSAKAGVNSVKKVEKHCFRAMRTCARAEHCNFVADIHVGSYKQHCLNANQAQMIPRQAAL